MKKLLFVCFTIFICAHSESYFIGVYYYPWYDYNRHWQEGYLRKKLLIFQPPLLGEYSSRSTTLIQNHLNWSLTNGIDFWVVSWWGPNSWENTTILNYIAPQLNGSNLKYCLFYETTGRLGDPPINFDNPTIFNTFISDFVYIAQHYFNQPNYLFWNGRPVVFIYLTRTFTGNYAGAIDSVRTLLQNQGYNVFLVGDEVYWGTPNQARIACFDAITSYNMHGPSQYAGYPANTNFLKNVSAKFNEYKNIANSLGVRFISNAMPGFNDRGVRLQANHYAIPNQYKQTWDHTTTFRRSLITSKIHLDNQIGRWLVITSWNEWHEDTQIEPTILTDTCSRDTSSTGIAYTQGYVYKGYEFDLLNTLNYIFGETDSILFYTSFENGEPLPFADSVYSSQGVDGYGSAPRPEAGRVTQEYGVPVLTGNYYLRIAGEDISSTQNSYCKYLLFDIPNIPIDKATFLSYFIYPYQKIHLMLGIITTDGLELQYSECIDQNENLMNPEIRNESIGNWWYIEVDLYPLLNRVIDKIYFVYDDNPNSEIGNYRCYVDDVKILTKKLGNVPIGERERMYKIKSPIIKTNVFYGRLPEIFKSGNIKVYDIAGRAVNKLTNNGVYFVQKDKVLQKIIYLK
ncbi:MAG: glycoside hydrolase family 99-like domain-containing protein [candidate division WOR-3 bacterium]